MRHRRVGRAVRPGASASGEICERGGRRGADRPVGCATSCAANQNLHAIRKALKRASCRQNDDPAIGADTPAGVLFSRNPGLPPKPGRGSTGERGVAGAPPGRCVWPCLICGQQGCCS